MVSGSGGVGYCVGSGLGREVIWNIMEIGC